MMLRSKVVFDLFSDPGKMRWVTTAGILRDAQGFCIWICRIYWGGGGEGGGRDPQVGIRWY